MERAILIFAALSVAACGGKKSRSSGDTAGKPVEPVTCETGEPTTETIESTVGFVPQCKSFTYQDAGTFFVSLTGVDSAGKRGAMTLLWTDQDGEPEAPEEGKAYTEADLNANGLQVAQGVYLGVDDKRANTSKSTLRFRKVPTGEKAPYEIEFEFTETLEQRPDEALTFSGTIVNDGADGALP